MHSKRRFVHRLQRQRRPLSACSDDTIIPPTICKNLLLAMVSVFRHHLVLLYPPTIHTHPSPPSAASAPYALLSLPHPTLTQPLSPSQPHTSLHLPVFSIRVFKFSFHSTTFIFIIHPPTHPPWQASSIFYKGFAPYPFCCQLRECVFESERENEGVHVNVFCMMRQTGTSEQEKEI